MKVGHSGTSVYFTAKYGLAEPIQRRLYVTILYDINQETTAPPSFFVCNLKAKKLNGRFISV